MPPLTEDARQQLQRCLYREFLLERDLSVEAGLDHLPAQLGERLGCQPDQAVESLTADALLEPLSLDELRQLLTIRDMTLVSRTAAAVASELKKSEASYRHCIRTALCYAVARMTAHAFSALRAAAQKRDDWARHHHIYGLLLALQGDSARALWELDMALQREPYEDSRIRIRRSIDLLEEPPVFA